MHWLCAELTRILPLSVSLLMLFQVHCFHRCASPWPGFPWGPGDPWSPFSPGDPMGPRGPTGPAWPTRPGLPLAPGIPGVPGVPGVPGTPTVHSLQLRQDPLGFWINNNKTKFTPKVRWTAFISIHQKGIMERRPLSQLFHKHVTTVVRILDRKDHVHFSGPVGRSSDYNQKNHALIHPDHAT